MTYSVYLNTLNNPYGIAYYQGHLYVGLYSTGKIVKINLNTLVVTDYYTFDVAYNVSYIRIYDNILHCSLIHKTDINGGKIVSINLDNITPTPSDYVIGIQNPRSFFIFETVLYIALANQIISYSNGSTTILINNATQLDGINVLDSPFGMDTEGDYIYFCNNGTNPRIYKCEYNGANVSLVTTLPQGNNDGLIIYGKNIFVASTNAQKIYKINKTDGTTTIFETLSNTDKPNMLYFLNNSLYISSSNNNSIFVKSVSSVFNSNFSLMIDNNNLTYSLNNNFTINNNWEEIGLTKGKITIDGNSNIITITNLNTDTLFFGGASNNTNRLEIKNLTIEANTDILSGLLRADGYVKINNCHFILNGNLLNYGGFIYNNLNTYNTIDIIMDKSSAVINGRIGDFSGPLLGCFLTQNNATITDSLSIVLNNIPLSGETTLESNSGAFVGSGVGLSSSISISNSYCIFNGTTKHSCGIIGGKYLGSGGNVTIDKFYAITNITNITPSNNPTDYAQFAYNLSSYTGGDLPNNITATNVNLLNFGINNLKMYADTNNSFNTLTGVTKYTDFNTFDTNANSEEAKIGVNTYYLNYKNAGVINSYLCYYPDYNIRYEVLIGTNIKILEDRILTIPDDDGNITKSYFDKQFSLNTVVEPSATLYYTSQNNNIATVENDIVTMHLWGSVRLFVNTLCDETYTYAEDTIYLTIERPESVSNLLDIGIPINTIYEINSIVLTNGQTLNTIPIDFTTLTIENQRIARHDMLDIIFQNNGITNFVTINVDLGLDDVGTSSIKVYKPYGGLQIINTNIINKSVYVNLYQNGNRFIFKDKTKTYTITKQVANYKVQQTGASGSFYNEGDIIRLGDYKMIFGGSHLYYDPINVPCLTDNTTVLTPNGYILISKLKPNDEIITSNNRIVNIVNIFKTTVEANKYTYPYIINKSSISANYPPKKTILSGGHLIRYKNKNIWIHPKKSKQFKPDKTNKLLNYYHIETPNYETDYLIINEGLIVESFTGHNEIYKKVRERRIKHI